MKNKFKLSMILGTFLIAFLITVFTSKPLEASPLDLFCHWKADTCPDGSAREICLFEGDGNICFCGTVSRKCPEIPE